MLMPEAETVLVLVLVAVLTGVCACMCVILEGEGGGCWWSRCLGVPLLVLLLGLLKLLL